MHRLFLGQESKFVMAGPQFKPMKTLLQMALDCEHVFRMITNREIKLLQYQILSN